MCHHVVALRHGRCANRLMLLCGTIWIGQAYKRHACAAMCWCWYMNGPVCHPVSAREHGKCMNRYTHTTKLRCWDIAGSSPHYHVVWLCWGWQVYRQTFLSHHIAALGHDKHANRCSQNVIRWIPTQHTCGQASLGCHMVKCVNIRCA